MLVLKMDKTDEELRTMAKKRVEFKSHAVVFIAVIAFLTIINLATSPGFLWVIFPAIFWGFWVLFQGIGAYSGGGVNTEEKEYQKLKAKYKKKA